MKSLIIAAVLVALSVGTAFAGNGHCNVQQVQQVVAVPQQIVQFVEVPQYAYVQQQQVFVPQRQVQRVQAVQAVPYAAVQQIQVQKVQAVQNRGRSVRVERSSVRQR